MDHALAGAQPEVTIHPTAVVDKGVRIGAGSRIWHFSHVMAGAVIGRDCRLGQNVFVGKGVRIGNRVKIQNNVSIYTGVTLEDDVFCGPSAVFTNVKDPRAAFPKDPASGYVATPVGRGATIGANATIICGVTIGARSFIGAGAVVTRDVPALGLVYGNPARLRGWTCVCGGRLPLKAAAARARSRCARCGRTFKQDGLTAQMTDWQAPRSVPRAVKARSLASAVRARTR